MINLKQDQRGILGVVEVGLIGVILIVLVFAGTRVYNATRQADQENEDAVKVSESSSPDFSKAIELAKEEDKEPEEEEKEEEKPETKPVEEESKPENEEKKEEEKDESEYIALAFSGVETTDETFKFTAQLGASRTGYCKVKIYQDGEDYIYDQTGNFSNKTSCTVALLKEDVPESGEWNGYVKFYSSDGKLVGATDEFEVELTL